MSGGKKKKSSSGTKSGGKKASSSKEKVKDTFFEESENVEDVIENSNTSSTSSSTKSPSSSTTANDADAFAANPSVDVLDRLAPPILFFPPNVAEEYLNRFCPVPQSVHGPPENSLLADEGFPDREIPVMRRLLAMMAGIMSKASAASARTYFSRVAGTEGRRNGYFQQNLNTSVFNLFSTLSAAGNPQAGDININISNNEKDLHLNPASAFTAKDGEPLRGYPTRLMKFWRQLSPTEQLRLVKEEHAALTNSWIESRQNWCLCAHCKHRRMTISDLTDCLYQTYCEELEAFLNSGGQGSTLYSPNLTNSMEPAAKARRFLFKSLSVVGEQALLPRYNQFILRLDAFSSMAFSMKDNNKERKNSSHKMKIPSDIKNEIKNGLKSAALQASKDFLQMQGKNAIEIEEFMSEKFLPPPSENLKKMSKAFDNPLEGLSIKVIRGSDDEDCIMLDRPNSSDSEISENEGSDLDDDEDDRESHQGGIQSEDDDDLIDEETDLPIDESELMLPGGASFPLLPAGDGPVQWSESSRIECGRTVFLMFASEMFQYRLTAAYLAHQTKLRQMKLLAEVEEEERLEKEKRAKEERERKEKMEADKKKKAAKKEKAAAKANGGNKTAKKLQTPAAAKKPVVESKNESESESEAETQVVAELGEENINNIDVAVELEPEPIEIESVIVVEPASPVTIVAEPVSVTIDQPKPQSQSSVTNENDSLLSSPLFPPTHKPPLQQPATTVTVDDDDFDPTLLVEQLSKEMNRFELYGDKSGLNTNPPGFAPPPGFAAAEPKHLDGRVGGGEEGGQYRYSGRPPFSLDYEGFYGYVPDGFNSHPSTNPNLQTYHQVQQQQMFMPPGYHQNPQPYDHFQGHPNFGYPTSSYNHQQSYPPPHTPLEYHNSLFNPIYYNRPPPPPPPPPQNQHQHQQDEVLEQGQSRFQSFFSKSIFGPSSFFSQ
jgi:hypothetical protein